jgi:N-methylhydantoinase A
MPAQTFRAGIDVGGTFTDLLLVDDETGVAHVAKTLTTPADPSVGVATVLRQALLDAGVEADALKNVIHGTTLVTNAIIERKGARTALITTQGFRDAIEIAREHRYDMYDMLLTLPQPLAPRQLRFEVRERVLADGSVYLPLDSAEIETLIPELQRRRVEAVAVVLLHSFRNPHHERAIGERLRTHIPSLHVALSSEVAPEIREYERTSTTLANVYVQPKVEQYLDTLEQTLHTMRFSGRLLIMLSNGGLGTVATARRFPVRLIESGPAAGALAAAHAGRRSGRLGLLSFDMGGTTAKACLIEDGRPATATEFEVDRVYRFKQGSGLPIKAPAIEMIEIGAGGGSIARIDQFGLIKVGPESAGAEPGPACYGRGGAFPTVTDADLVLGYLNPAYFLGGQMPLDRAAAEHAVQEHIATPLGTDVTAAAWAIHRIVNENMAAASRMHAVERGRDVRRFPLFAFGGAGPVHADQVADILGLSHVIAPFAAGVGSTLGFLAAPIAFDFVRGTVGRLDQLDWVFIQRLYDEMEAEGSALLREALVPQEAVQIRRTCDMRLSGQAHQTVIDVPSGPLSAESATILASTFEATYRRLYTRAVPGVPIETLNWRVTVSGPPPDLRIAASALHDGKKKIKGRRQMYLADAMGFVEAPVYDRYALAAGDRFEGPAIVEERESTLVVGPGRTVDVDTWLSLVVTISKDGTATHANPPGR